MPYKRSSRIARHFPSPKIWPFGSKTEFFNTHAMLHQLTHRFWIADDPAAAKNIFGDPHRSALSFVLVDSVRCAVSAHRFVNGGEERLFPKARK